VTIDGSGRLEVGSSGNNSQKDPPNLQFSPNAFNALASWGTAGLVQSTWRELPPGG
jgi:hypothetical protein